MMRNITQAESVAGISSAWPVAEAAPVDEATDQERTMGALVEYLGACPRRRPADWRRDHLYAQAGSHFPSIQPSIRA